MADSLYQIGLGGMQRAIAGIADKADKISRAFTPDSDSEPSGDIIGLKLDEFQYKASAKVIKTADELSKTVLDILA